MNNGPLRRIAILLPLDSENPILKKSELRWFCYSLPSKYGMEVAGTTVSGDRGTYIVYDGKGESIFQLIRDLFYEDFDPRLDLVPLPPLTSLRELLNTATDLPPFVDLGSVSY